MALDPVLPIAGPAGNPVEVTAAQWRRLDVGSTMMHETHDVAVRSGVCAGLSATVSGMTVTVVPGSALVTPAVTTNGSYRVSVGSATALTLNARDATYTRQDLIVLRVQDSEIDGSGQYLGSLVVVAGTPSAAPAPPAVPAGTLPLWVAVVPPSGTVTLVDRRQYTSSLGGVLTCTSGTLPVGSSLRPGQMVYETDTSIVRTWTGTAWQIVAAPNQPYAMAAGSLSVTLSNVTMAATNVNFTAGRFSQPPIVVGGCTDYGHRLLVRCGNVSTGGFTLNVMTANGATTTVTANITWIALQQLPGSAAG